MKKYLLLLLIFISVTAISAKLYFDTNMPSQSISDSSFEKILKAIKTGEAKELARYFDNTIEITFSEKSNSYSKSQAELVLRDFFANNPVKGFELIHQSESTASQYCIGSLATSTGSFRTTIYIKQKGDKQLVQELRFEK